MEEEEGERYIRTVNGKIKESDVICKNNITTLPYEHIIQNLCDYIIEEKDFIDIKDKIELKNLHKISIKPFSTYQNLYLEADVDKTANELINVKNNYSCTLICDVTTKTHGQNLKCLREISTLTNIYICHGLSLDYSYKDIKQYLNDIQYEFHYGFEDQIPSFIGEVFISEQFPSGKEDEMFQMLITLINQYEIPIFIKLNSKQKHIKTNTILPYLNQKGISNRRKWVFALSVGDKDNFDDHSLMITEIVKCGYSVIISVYDCDIEKKENSPIDQYYFKEKSLFLNRTLVDLRQFIKQIMISNNINYKIQLKEYGGFGYDNLFMSYYKEITQNLNKEEINNLAYQNLISLLNWWKKPKEKNKSIPMIKCVTCGAEKEEDDKDIFRKFDKSFCTFSCLKKYLNTKK